MALRSAPVADSPQELVRGKCPPAGMIRVLTWAGLKRGNPLLPASEEDDVLSADHFAGHRLTHRFQYGPFNSIVAGV